MQHPVSSSLAASASQAADPMEEVAGLMTRLAEEPDSESVYLPQLLSLSETLPHGPTRGALASSVAALTRLRAWLNQLQDRQRLSTRIQDVAARLSQREGLQVLMRAIADEARMMVDAPVARLDVFSPLMMTPGSSAASAASGSFMSQWPELGVMLESGYTGRAARCGSPVLVPDCQSDRSGAESAQWESQVRQESLHGLMVIPLMMQAQCCGFLQVADRVVRHWSPLDMEALQQLAAMAVRALGRTVRAEAAQHTLTALHERTAAMHQAHASSPLQLLLQGVPTAVQQAYAEGLLGTLIRADRSRGTTLARTLLTYMDHGHNARAAARVLGVHVNTLHNRLETISSLLPDWHLPERSLELHVALRLCPDLRAPL